MTYTTIIEPADLAEHLGDPGWVILDCRFSLQDTEQGQRDYLAAHIPGAGYLHLDRDLSGAVIPGKTGRHPLPEADTARQTFASLGIHPGVQVAAYDSAGGSLAAARAWWLLRWLGFESAAVLDGGWQAWVEAGLPQQASLTQQTGLAQQSGNAQLSGLAQLSGEEPRASAVTRLQPRPELAVSSQEVERMRLNPAYWVVDARSADRYRGENETIDPVAGHIPGATNAPYKDVLSATGKLLSGEDLRAYYLKLLGGVEAGRTVFYCGSGVTASLHILAMLHAGLGEARLYAGSWSEWITDARRPIAR